MTTKAKLLIEEGDSSQAVTGYSLDVTTGSLTLKSADHSVSFALNHLVAPNHSEGNHDWSRWQSYLVKNTDWQHGLYNTTSTPHQRRVCIGCGLEEDRRI